MVITLGEVCSEQQSAISFQLSANMHPGGLMWTAGKVRDPHPARLPPTLPPPLPPSHQGRYGGRGSCGGRESYGGQVAGPPPAYGTQGQASPLRYATAFVHGY